MSFSGESEGEEGGEGSHFHPKFFMASKTCLLDQVHDCMIVFLIYNVLVNEVGQEGGVALGKVLTVNHMLQRLR